MFASINGKILKKDIKKGDLIKLEDVSENWMAVFIVIPAFNEQDTIESVIKSAFKYVENIIVVNDCIT